MEVAMSASPQVLFISSDPEGRGALSELVTQFGVEAVSASSVKEALSTLSREPIRLVLCDAQLPGGGVRDILAATARRAKKVPVVVTSRLDSWDEYLKAMRWGAFDYVVYPFRRDEVQWILERALRGVPIKTVWQEREKALKTA
jgi:DNA-binding NtrC family response regulator